MDDITYSVCISQHSLAFSNGKYASMYGKGGTEYTWRDPPSFGVVGSLILTMLSNEEELLHTTKLIVDAHPAVVNSRDPETGQSLLQFVIAHANRNRLIDLLLSAQCRIGLQADSRGRTCLHVALEQGKWHALQQLLDALQAERFSVIPGSMRLVAECFEAIANDYPRDFLHYIGNLPLQTEPEVLGDIEAFDVMLPSTLICGSSQRCPKGIWTSKLTQYSAARDNQQSMAEHASTSSFAAPTLERSSTASFDRNSLPAEGVRSRLSLTRPASAARLSSSSARPSTGQGARQSCGDLSMVSRQPSLAGGLLGGLLASGNVNEKSESKESAQGPQVEMGYNKVSRGGLQAMRVPIENFAGRLEAAAGGYSSSGVAPLQLIVDAVDVTGDYSVFMSPLLKIVLEFKWYGFARQRFNLEFLAMLLHTTMVLIYNLRLSATIRLTLPDLLGLPGSAYPGVPNYLVLAGWLETTAMCIYTLSVEIRQMRHGLYAYFSYIWNYIDWVYILGQGAVNALFWLRDVGTIRADAMLLEFDVNGTAIATQRRLAAPLVDSFVHAAAAVGTFDGAADEEDPAQLLLGAGRQLRGRGPGGGVEIVGETRSNIGIFVLLQSVVVLMVTLRLLFFFRGSLRLGALTHTLGRIIIDIIPLMVLLVVFVVAFTGATMILVMHELDIDYFPQWHDFMQVMFLIVNMGVYSQTDSEAIRVGRSSGLLLSIYILFMLMVQVIILNMLIAIMAETYSRVANQAELVAQCGRAALILEYETAEITRLRRAARRHRRHKGRRTSAGSDEHASFFADLIPHGTSERERLEQVCPRWLHILMPAEHTRGDEASDAQKQAKLLKAVEKLSARQGKMLEAAEWRDDAAAEKRMMQTVRTELHQMRDEMKVALGSK